jgi:hypothetical protein
MRKLLTLSAVVLLAMTGVLAAVNPASGKGPTRGSNVVTQFYGPGELVLSQTAEWGGAYKGSLACTSTSDNSAQDGVYLPFDLPDGASITKVTPWFLDFAQGTEDANPLDPDFTYPTNALTFQVVVTHVGYSDIEPAFDYAFSTDTPLDFRSVELTPTAPVVVDAGSERYGLSVRFGACGSTVTLDDGDFPALVMDSVQVEYVAH